MYATFTGFEIKMTKNDALSMSHQGQCIDDVKAFLKTNKSIHKQLTTIGDKKIAEELKTHGAWDDSELADVESNKEKIVWIASCYIREGN